MATSSELLNNRYLLWLHQGAKPPVRGSMGKAREAVTVLANEVLKAKRCLRQAHPTWAHWHRFQLAKKNLESLLGLVQCQASISRRLTPTKAKEWVDHWEQWAERLYRPMTEGVWRNRLLALAHHEGTEVAGRDVGHFLDNNSSHPVFDRLARLQLKKQEKREKDYVEDRRVRGGVQAWGTPEGVHRCYLKKARQAGAEKGTSPYLFRPFTSESWAVRTTTENSELRRLLWLEDIHAPVPTAAVESRRALRHAMAQSEDWNNYAEYTLAEAIYPHPSKLVHALRQARKRLRSDATRLRQAMLNNVNARQEGVDPLTKQPWDWEKVDAEAFSWGTQTPFETIFPWRETALKIFGELLPLCGWTYAQAPEISGEGLWSVIHFQIEQQEDGHKAHLFYSPFRPHQKGNSEYSAGEAYLFNSGWHPKGQQGTVPCVWINQALDEEERCYDIEQLRVLCHEIGHALHYISLPEEHAAESWSVPSDIMEVPSHLLELYPRDPAVLARWASKKGPAAAQRSRYWNNKLRQSPSVLLDHQNYLRSAEADLRLSMNPDEPFQAICRDVLESDGLPFLKEDGSWRRLYLWDDHLVCNDYTQCLPPSIARRLVTLTDRGTVDAATVVATYNQLISEVLSTGTTAKRAARNWKQWTGETFATSIHMALLGHAQQTARIGRRGTVELRRKTLALKRKRAAVKSEP